MNLLKKILCLFILSNSLTCASPASFTDTETMQTFMSVYQDIEQYRSWTASKIHELDFTDQHGNIDEEAKNYIDEVIESGTYSFVGEAILKNKRLSHACKYLYMCNDKVNDYFISESIYSSFDFIFKKLLAGEDYKTPLAIWLQDVKDVVKACGYSLYQIADNVSLDRLPDRYKDILTQNDAINTQSFFLSMSNQDIEVLSCGHENKDNLFCGILLSNVLTKLEYLDDQKTVDDRSFHQICQILKKLISKPKISDRGNKKIKKISQMLKAFNSETKRKDIDNALVNQIIQMLDKLTLETKQKDIDSASINPISQMLDRLISETKQDEKDNIMNFFPHILCSFSEFNGFMDAVKFLEHDYKKLCTEQEKRSHRRLISIYTDAKFHFENFASRIHSQVIDFLTLRYHGHLEIPENLFGTTPATADKKTAQTKKRKAPSSKKSKKRNHKKRKKVKNSSHTEPTIAKQKLDEVLVDDNNEELTTNDNPNELTSAIDVEEKLESARSSDEENDNDHVDEYFEFNFDQWYEENVIPFAMKADSRKNETPLNLENQKAEEETKKFTLQKKARKFYLSTIGRQKEPVKKRHFVAFLASIGGVLDESGGDGSAVKYWLPNFSDSRDKTRFLKFTVHLPHSGSEHFPWKTLKNFIYLSLVRCDLMPHRFSF